MSNQGWLGNNGGTFERLTGTFKLVEKVSGFSTVKSGAIGLDVSTAGLAVAIGVIQETVFSGLGNHVKGYTSQSYPGYNFTNAWTVDCPGIPREGDGDATGDINFPGDVGGANGYTSSLSNGAEKVWGKTNSGNLFRFTELTSGPNPNNRLTYTGAKKRYFQVNASISYRLTNTNTTVKIYIAKNGDEVPQTAVYGRVSTTTDIFASTIVGSIELKQNDYIEIWVVRTDGGGSMFTVSLNLTAR